MTTPNNTITPPINRRQLRLPPHINESAGHQYVDRWRPADLPWIVMGGTEPYAPGWLTSIGMADGPAFDLEPYGVRFFSTGPYHSGVSNIYPAKPTDASMRSAWHVGVPNPTYNFTRGSGLLIDMEGSEMSELQNNNYQSAKWHRQATWNRAFNRQFARAWPDELIFSYMGGWPGNDGLTWVEDRKRILKWDRFLSMSHGIGLSLYNYLNSTTAIIPANEVILNRWTQEGCAAMKALSNAMPSHPLVIDFLGGIFLYTDFLEIPQAQLISNAVAALEGGADVLFFWDEYAYRHSLHFDDPTVIAHQKRVLNALRIACGREEI